MPFAPATREKSLLRMALMGPSGNGKSYTALKLMTYLLDPDQVFAVIDTERDSARKYAPLPGEKADPESGTFNFLHSGITNYSPENYIALIKEAEKAKIPGLVIDSLSHAWFAKGGILDQKDTLDQNSKNSYTNWRSLTPKHNDLVEAILDYPGHVIVTLRTKMEYAQTKDENGKGKVEKLGLGAIQRDDVEYEFDVVMMMTSSNAAEVTKTRYSIIANQTIQKPGQELAETLRYWLGQGGEAALTKSKFEEECLTKFDLMPAQIGPMLAQLKIKAQGYNRYNLMLEALETHFATQSASA